MHADRSINYTACYQSSEEIATSFMQKLGSAKKVLFGELYCHLTL